MDVRELDSTKIVGGKIKKKQKRNNVKTTK